MSKTKYLYGASVQGIQDFIFQTNKLKEIVGASELVEQICTTAFKEMLEIKQESWIIGAAGNIKYIFDNKDDCENIVLNFPKKIMTMAPGITINQAVVKMEGHLTEYADASNELEKRLRTQRNKLVRSMTLGLMAISRAPSTGLPAVEDGKDGLIDEAAVKKTQNSQTTKAVMQKLTGCDRIEHRLIAYDFKDIEGKNTWIAVIHADGNGLGNIVQAVCKNENDAQKFSRLLDEITKMAAQEAYREIEKDLEKDKVIPIRPIVLGGDDLTVICRADLAIDFVSAFLEIFEDKSKCLLDGAEWKNPDWKMPDGKPIAKKLTACAGIAFVKSSFPFHYSIELAENLCRRAKKAAKDIDRDLAPACLMFHKVQDSFVEDFSEIVKRELTPQINLSFEYGPYYCGKHAKTKGAPCEKTVEKLSDNAKYLRGKEGNAIKSHLRQWLSALHENVEVANQIMKRLRTINEKAKKMIDEKYEKLNSTDSETIPYHDILSLTSILFVDIKKQGGTNHE